MVWWVKSLKSFFKFKTFPWITFILSVNQMHSQYLGCLQFSATGELLVFFHWNWFSYFKVLEHNTKFLIHLKFQTVTDPPSLYLCFPLYPLTFLFLLLFFFVLLLFFFHLSSFPFPFVPFSSLLLFPTVVLAKSLRTWTISKIYRTMLSHAWSLVSEDKNVEWRFSWQKR